MLGNIKSNCYAKSDYRNIIYMYVYGEAFKNYSTDFFRWGGTPLPPLPPSIIIGLELQHWGLRVGLTDYWFLQFKDEWTFVPVVPINMPPHKCVKSAKTRRYPADSRDNLAAEGSWKSYGKRRRPTFNTSLQNGRFQTTYNAIVLLWHTFFKTSSSH